MEKSKHETPVVGKRYWLDSVRDVSGLCEVSEDGNYRFSNQEGKIYYEYENDGLMHFTENYNFYPVDQPSNPQV